MKSVIFAYLFVLTLLLSGCGGTASANAPAVSSAGSDLQIVDAANPAAPLKAPTFHQVDAKRMLPSHLTIPAIAVDTPVVELGWSQKQTTDGAIFSEWDVADYAAGWHKNSMVPGERGNIVMSGHNNIKGSVFRELDQLKRGDEIDVTAGGVKYRYAVEDVLIVPEKYATAAQRAANLRYIEPTDDDRLTLVSCWPRNDNTHRIIVIARPSANAVQ